MLFRQIMRERKMDGKSLMPFGKHKGIPMEEISTGYFLWLVAQPWFENTWPRVYTYIKEYTVIFNPVIH